MQISSTSRKTKQSTGSNQKSTRFMMQWLVTELALLAIGVLEQGHKGRKKNKTEMD